MRGADPGRGGAPLALPVPEDAHQIPHAMVGPASRVPCGMSARSRRRQSIREPRTSAARVHELRSARVGCGVGSVASLPEARNRTDRGSRLLCVRVEGGGDLHGSGPYSDQADLVGDHAGISRASWAHARASTAWACSTCSCSWPPRSRPAVTTGPVGPEGAGRGGLGPWWSPGCRRRRPVSWPGRPRSGARTVLVTATGALHTALVRRCRRPRCGGIYDGSAAIGVR